MKRLEKAFQEHDMGFSMPVYSLWMAKWKKVSKANKIKAKFTDFVFSNPKTPAFITL